MGFKIVYAAGKSHNSKVQLERFLQAVKNEPYEIKIAAHKGFYPRGYSVDWTLDKLWIKELKNTLYDAYLDQVGRFNPDLLISDICHPTTSIASFLKKPIWQYSSSLLFESLAHNNFLKKQVKFAYETIVRIKGYIEVATQFCYSNSDINFVCSHLADTIYSKHNINKDFFFLRPYHSLGKITDNKYNISSAYIKNRKLIDLVKRYDKSILFSDFYQEEYNGLEIKDIGKQDVYADAIRNSSLFVCDGNAGHIADAFYNKKPMVYIPNMFDKFSIINSSINERCGYGSWVYRSTDDISKDLARKELDVKLDANVQYLHEKINAYFKVKVKK